MILYEIQFILQNKTGIGTFVFHSSHLTKKNACRCVPFCNRTESRLASTKKNKEIGGKAMVEWTQKKIFAQTRQDPLFEIGNF